MKTTLSWLFIRQTTVQVYTLKIRIQGLDTVFLQKAIWAAKKHLLWLVLKNILFHDYRPRVELGTMPSKSS